MELNCFFDGACEPTNPGGHASFGVIVRREGEPLLYESGYVGHGPGISNNVAEFAGAIRILEFLLTRDEHAVIHGDSKLVVNLLNGRWKGKGGLYWPYFQKAKELVSKLGARVRFEWIGREWNSECDELSKQVLLDRGIIFRIQPQ